VLVFKRTIGRGQRTVGWTPDDIVQIPAASPHIPAIIEREAHRIIHEFCQRVHVGVTVDPNQPHGVIDDIDAGFRAEDLRHHGEFVFAAFGKVVLLAGFPGHVAACLDPHLSRSDIDGPIGG
jgi:hypothetical protein